MAKIKYPKLQINTNKITENAQLWVDKCKDKGIEVAGVIKGASGLESIIQAMEKGGVSSIASSRILQLLKAKEIGVKIPLMLLRIPMLSEVEDVIKVADISLNSELVVLESLNKEANRQNKIHKVILMADLGDLREGWWNYDDLIETAYLVENTMDNLYLYGIGTNLGCYGAIAATNDKLNELVNIAEKIEEKIGRSLDIISGGATSSLPRIFHNDMPNKINHLRIGEGILIAPKLDIFNDCDLSSFHKDACKLFAEVVEIKDKPTYPVGEITIDAFGNTPEYIDRGIRKRAILGVGKNDYMDIYSLIPINDGIKVIGGSGDHTMIDIEDVTDDLHIGDIVEFNLVYVSLLYLSHSNEINIEVL